MKTLVSCVCALALLMFANASLGAPVNLLSMKAPDVANYVDAHTHPLGKSFGDQNAFVGPFLHEPVTRGTAIVQVAAVVFKHETLVSIPVSIHYTANLWAFYRSAVLDDGTSVSIGKVDRNFGECEVDGCPYSETMVIDIPIKEVISHIGKPIGVRIYGDNAVATITVPAGYMAGFTSALRREGPSP